VARKKTRRRHGGFEAVRRPARKARVAKCHLISKLSKLSKAFTLKDANHLNDAVFC